jgi:hypothetical protein
METGIGVFAARERAEEAVKSLLEQNVPKESIVYLTRSESEAKSVGKELGACWASLVNCGLLPSKNNFDGDGNSQ